MAEAFPASRLLILSINAEKSLLKVPRQRIWITWERQRRSVELSAHFGCTLFEIIESGALRYPKSVLITIRLLLAHRDSLVFVQNPSMLLAALVTVWGKIFGMPVVVDRHSTFMLNRRYPLSLGLILFKILDRVSLRLATRTIVTNEFLASLVRRRGGSPFVLPDKLPEAIPTKSGERRRGEEPAYLFVGSFAEDEPLHELFEALREMESPRPRVFVSGKKSRAPARILAEGEGLVEFTDFLPDKDYFELLCAVDAVMVLTTADHTMLCGCYEVVAAEQVLVTSDKAVLREYFTSAVFVDNSPLSIKEALSMSDTDRRLKQEEIVQLKRRLGREWAATAHTFDAILNGL